APTTVTSRPSRIHVIPRAKTTTRCQCDHGNRSSRAGTSVVWRLGLEKLVEAVLIEDRYAQRFGFRQLAAGLGARDDVVGLFADGPGHFAAGLDDLGSGLFTRHRRQGPRQDERLAGERTGRFSDALGRAHIDARA